MLLKCSLAPSASHFLSTLAFLRQAWQVVTSRLDAGGLDPLQVSLRANTGGHAGDGGQQVDVSPEDFTKWYLVLNNVAVAL